MASLPQCRLLECAKHFSISVTDLVVMAASCLIFMGSFHLNQYFDSYMLYAPGVSLIFLPAGIKLLAILVGRFPAIVGLYMASVYMSTKVWHDLQMVSLYLFAAASVFSYAIVAYVVLKLVGVLHDLNNLRYHHIVLLSLTASVLNGVIHGLAYSMAGVAAADVQWVTSAAMALGDFLGCLAIVSVFHVTTLMFKKV
jgi:hypothetical protein